MLLINKTLIKMVQKPAMKEIHTAKSYKRCRKLETDIKVLFGKDWKAPSTKKSRMFLLFYEAP